MMKNFTDIQWVKLPLKVINQLTLLFLFLPLTFHSTAGQHLPHAPFSFRFFNPQVLNPAITGSKDFSSIHIYATLPQSPPAQLISGDGRFLKKVPGYVFGDPGKEFSNFGIGGFLFNDMNAGTGRIGAAASLAYHIPVNRQATSFLSFGASYKGIQSYIKRNTEDNSSSDNSESLFFNNLDLGIYFYSARFYAGFSGQDIMENFTGNYKLREFGFPLEHQYFFNTGYKFVISRDHNIIIEPSVFLNTTGPDIDEIADNLYPILKLYLMDFCAGANFHDLKRLSFFFQYRYPRFFIGAYFDYPLKSAYYIREPLIELSFGFNLSGKDSGPVKPSRW